VCYDHLGLGKRGPVFRSEEEQWHLWRISYVWIFFFLFAVICMHRTVDQLLYMGRTEICPFIRDPFSRGDMYGGP